MEMHILTVFWGFRSKHCEDFHCQNMPPHCTSNFVDFTVSAWKLRRLLPIILLILLSGELNEKWQLERVGGAGGAIKSPDLPSDIHQFIRSLNY